MRLPWITTCFLLGFIIVLDPTPTPAQFGRKGGDGGGKREFRKGDFGGNRGDFNGFQPRGNFNPGGPAPSIAPDNKVVLYGAGGAPAESPRPAFTLTSPGGPSSYQMPPNSGSFGGNRPFGGGGPGSGFGGPGGGRGFDPSSMWDRISRGRDSINLNDPENSRTRSMMERFGTPIPANGILTKEAYLAGVQQRMSSMSGSPPGGVPAGPTMVSLSGPTSSDGRLGFTPGFGGDRGSFNPGGFGGDRDRDRDRGAERLREQDRDNDGRVSRAEADRQLQPNYERIDRDNDGFITLDEYRGYYAAQNNDRDRDRDRDRNRDMSAWGGGAWGGDGGGWGNRQESRGQSEEPRPVAIRYGHLPKELPAWFDEYDTTRDGQVALHEWLKGAKAAGEPATVESFSVYDLNDDQLITAEEVLRYDRLQADARRIAVIQEGGSGSTRASQAGPGGSRMRGPGGSMSGFSRPDSRSDADVSSDRGTGKRGSDKKAESSEKPEKSEKSEQAPGSNGRWGTGGKKVKS